MKSLNIQKGQLEAVSDVFNDQQKIDKNNKRWLVKHHTKN